MNIWKTINRFPDYEICVEGVVRRATGGRGAIKGKILKWHTHTSTGYPDVRFSVDGKQTAVPVHQLVAKAWRCMTCHQLKNRVGFTKGKQ